MISSLLEVHGKSTDEILEATLGGVIRQKGFAYNGNTNTCVYRQESTGFRCAVGQIIDDAIYFEEGNDGTNVIGYVDLPKAKTGMDARLTDLEFELLSAIQAFHDDAAAKSHHSAEEPIFSELDVAKRLYAADVFGHGVDTISLIRDWLNRKIEELEAA